MKSLSIKKLKRLLALSIFLLVILLIYVSYLKVKVDHLPLAKEISSYFIEDARAIDENNTSIVSNDGEGDNEEQLDHLLDVEGRVSEEETPENEALQRDAIIDQNKIDTTSEIEIKTPTIDRNKFHSTFGREVVFIYFSHNRESFLPYFNKGTLPENAYHSDFNVSLIGERLGKALKHNGVWSSVSEVDIITMLDERKLNFNSSYQMSRELVVDAKRNNRNLELFFDLHRDSLPKKYTTMNFNGEPYAKISFVIGSGHPNYKENLAFTNELNDRINQTYPGLSRGVIIKDSSQGNGVYNQDLSPSSVIIEVGGVDNTIEELYRTADVLGFVIGQYYWGTVN
ncbi:stage II sporulation protein P [Bacillus sp. DJP31]|uniref:stage II sporulation protein P n=1 Tax=Bacillus sp. DJP31 TaxID=3409789 RepID=UPI003BB5DC85